MGLVSEADYAKDVRHVEMFLAGQSNEVIDELVGRMESAAEELDFELAARLRDRITSLRRIQERQYVAGARGDVDVIACVTRENLACVQVFVIRDGQNLGNQTFFPAGARRYRGRRDFAGFYCAALFGPGDTRRVVGQP